ncbi:hypothetical protein HYV81_00015 [Candidatus Woesearchaeota archaeon]|nr:hypothetical protein [Candidatus Woesearchaeota archaeon]
MRKVQLITILLLFVVVFAGCKKSDTKTLTGKDINFHRGSEGIVVTFLPNSPPSRVFQNQDIAIHVQAENKGAYDSEYARLFISGFERSSLQGNWQDGSDTNVDLTLNGPFRGKSQVNPEGALDIKTYTAKAAVPVSSADKYTANVLITSCYSYRTQANPVVCIDPDPFSVVRKDKVCEVRDVGLAGGQGAPIAITKVEEEVGNNKVFFRIFISNVGNGKVMKPEIVTTSKCPYGLDVLDINKVQVTQISVPSLTLDKCEPELSRGVTLINGQGFVFCSFNLPQDKEQTSYTTPLNIELSYGYSSSVQKQLEIVNIQ